MNTDDAKKNLIEEMTEKIYSGELDMPGDLVPNDLPLCATDEDLEDEEIINVPAKIDPNRIGDMTVGDGKIMPVVMKDNFDVMQDSLTKMISGGMQNIGSLSKLATDMEHPRVYEVLCTMMTTMKGLNDQMLTLTEKRHKIGMDLDSENGQGHSKEPNKVGGGVTNIKQAIFVGSTTELQEFMKTGGMTGAGKPQS